MKNPCKLLPFLLVFMCSCVAVSEDMLKDLPQPSQAVEPPYTGLGPGHKSYETAHFLVKAYSTDRAIAYSVICEENYSRIMNDIGLYSFAPVKPYNVVVYRDQEEFMQKTSQPKWSGGVAYGNAILLYDSPGAKSVLAHEMSHLIFNEFMGPFNSRNLKWMNEGLAVHEEMRASADSRNFYSSRISREVAVNPLPFSQMINLAPQGEKDETVEKWYAQVGSVVSFLIREGGTLGFSIFLSRLKDGNSPDAAVKEAFSGLWQNMGDMEKAWLLNMQN